MNRYFHTMANYNHEANNAMFSIIEGLPEETRKRNVRSYYHSIDGIINHIYNSDLLWLVRIKARFPHFASLDASVLDKTPENLHASLFPDFGALRSGRTVLDGIFIQLSAEVDEGVLQKVLDYHNTRGEAKRYILWETMIHIFNHQTHHRGQIAEILDELGTTNDYSNVISYLSEPSRG